MDIALIIRSTLYFLALINPASKIFILSTVDPPYSKKDLMVISVRSTIVAAIILVILAAIGNFILLAIFNVNLYSLKVAGGIVLFIVGLTAVRKGRFYEESALEQVSDISIVPLAAPLIAGPGTITAAISYSSMHGLLLTIICILISLIINLLLMLVSSRIGRALEKINGTGPLIRITGLVVTSVAVQMIFSGLADWMGEM
ncbi:MarC family protein [bacterium]|nr:MarC family protein [bacterium]RQV98957.1 MAG: MarC family protein [bacterium]